MASKKKIQFHPAVISIASSSNLSAIVIDWLKSLAEAGQSEVVAASRNLQDPGDLRQEIGRQERVIEMKETLEAAIAQGG